MRDVHRLDRLDAPHGLAVALLVLAVAAGCGGSGGSSSASGPGGGSTTPAVSGSAGSVSPTSRSSGGNDSAGFGWVPFGPTDPGDPPPNRWYGPLADHNCSGLAQALHDEPGGALWDALDALCAAAIVGDQSQWAVAETQATAASADTSGGAGSGTTGCLADAAKALLARALAWHADHPAAKPTISLPRAGQKTACPFRITSITLVDSNGDPVAGALQGPVSGGTQLAINGAGLGGSPTVLIAGHRATVVRPEGSGAGIIVATPAVSHPLVGRIRVGNEAGQLLAKVDFRYVASSGSPS